MLNLFFFISFSFTGFFRSTLRVEFLAFLVKHGTRSVYIACEENKNDEREREMFHNPDTFVPRCCSFEILMHRTSTETQTVLDRYKVCRIFIFTHTPNALQLLLPDVRR